MVDVTELTMGILSDALPTVSVTTQFPADSLSSMGSGTYVVVSQTSDESDDFVLVPTMQMLCCAETDATAAALARSCVEALQDAALDHPLLSAVQMVDLGRDSYTSRGGRHRAIVRLYVNID